MLYLDTEFNGFDGQLISLALVSSEDGEEFYGVLPLPSKIHPWVKEHVIPYLVQDSEPHHMFRSRLALYLLRHQHETIIADWPADFVHLLECLYEPNGMSYKIELDFRLVNSGKLDPVIPHNALSDARALMYWHISQKE